jgi:hypothetical protein
MRPSAPTPEELSLRLQQPGRYGRSGSQVLETCSLVLAADQAWDPETTKAFLSSEEIHPKVWDKLLGIARCKHLQQVDPSSLPGNYTALYALVGMGPEEWQAALEQKVVLPNASSRLILDWLRRFRANDLEDEAQEFPITLVTSYVLSESEHASLLQDLRKAAGAYGIKVVEGKLGVRSRKVVEKERKIHEETLLQRLLKSLRGVVEGAPADLRQQFSMAAGLDLVNADLKRFTGFLVTLSGGRDPFWERYGGDYCHKLALEYNRTDSRAQRGNHKRRLKEVMDKQGEQGRSEVCSIANKVLGQFMDD